MQDALPGGQADGVHLLAAPGAALPAGLEDAGSGFSLPPVLAGFKAGTGLVKFVV